MKTIFALLLAALAATQTSAQTNYARVDSIARTFKSRTDDAGELARQLTRDFQTEAEKARALFTWIAENIRYDYAEFKNPSPKPRFRGRTRAELEEEKKEWLEGEIEYTMRKKRGVCADYSRLFQRMCETVGLESTVINGISRRARGGRGGSHAWNAVKVDGQWRLLDATWGAGYVDDEEDRFVQRFSGAFFDTPPSLFILNHLPEEEKWQLLQTPVAKENFTKQAAVNYASPDFTLLAFEPADGKVRPKNGQAEIRLRFATQPGVLNVAVGTKRILPSEMKQNADGWTVLTFSPGSATDVQIFAGRDREKTEWIGKFSMQ